MASPTSATAPVPTNTITITNLHSCHFEEAPLQALRAQADSFGQVCFFSPIKSFKRIFVVYHTTEDAIKAKTLHSTHFQGTILRVYFGQHTELSIDPEKYYLHLPENAKSCSEQTGLVSPPGSPPLGHVEDEAMPTIDDDFSLEAAATASPTLALTVEAPTAAESSTPAAVPAQSLQHQIRKLRIDTHLRPSSISTLKSSPRSPVSPSSSLYPTTPTLLAFSPAIESQGEQPFITIQDWGMEEEEVEPVAQHTPVAHTPTFAAFTRCY
ncbi:hypothetical protein EC968_008431 [Mortierella alpina]|nr:hypothetical protein EC968_008431 [Mortierella alpina]